MVINYRAAFIGFGPVVKWRPRNRIISLQVDARTKPVVAGGAGFEEFIQLVPLRGHALKKVYGAATGENAVIGIRSAHHQPVIIDRNTGPEFCAGFRR